MKSRIKVLILIIPVIFAGMILFGCSQKDYNEKKVLSEIKEQPDIEVPVLVNESLFYGALDKVKKSDVDKNFNVYGGIVPHHDLASELIADFFQKLSQYAEPKTFIILGPNHSDVALAPAISGRVTWQTPFGSVSNNYEILEELKEEGAVTYDEENFSKEHSIAVLTPFIAYYFPESLIAPIIFTSKHDREQSLALAEELEKYLNEDTILISSLDFSHYLPSDLTAEKDELTLELIKSKDYETIAKLNSDYIDSPACLIVLLRAMELMQVPGLEILQHSEAGQLINQELESSTSYFTLFFTKQ